MKKDTKRTFYNDLAVDFDKVMNMYDTDKRVRIVYDELLPGNLKGKLLLDAGCGTGWFSKKAAEKGARIVSLDIGERLVRIALQKGKGRGVAADLLSIPFADSTFDIVVCSEAIEHTTDPQKAFSELSRVLAKGGTLVITVPNRFWHWSVRLADALKLRPYEGYENWCGWSELKAWSKANGLRIEALEGFHLFPFIFSFTNPVLDFFDRFKKGLGPVMVNIALKAKKT